jgi:hypothetical protein
MHSAIVERIKYHSIGISQETIVWRSLLRDGELYICDLEDEVYKAVKESNEEQLLELLEGGANPNSWVRGSRRAKRRIDHCFYWLIGLD